MGSNPIVSATTNTLVSDFIGKFDFNPEDIPQTIPQRDGDWLDNVKTLVCPLAVDATCQTRCPPLPYGGPAA